MPKMNGFELCQSIRNKLKLTTPVVAVTANLYEDDKAKCFASGMDDILPKPVRLESLIEILNKYLGTKLILPPIAKEEKTMPLKRDSMIAPGKRHDLVNQLNYLSSLISLLTTGEEIVDKEKLENYRKSSHEVVHNIYENLYKPTHSPVNGKVIL